MKEIIKDIIENFEMFITITIITTFITYFVGSMFVESITGVM